LFANVFFGKLGPGPFHRPIPIDISSDDIYGEKGNTIALLQLPAAHSEMTLSKNGRHCRANECDENFILQANTKH
jgi:hypothetical protein